MPGYMPAGRRLLNPEKEKGGRVTPAASRKK